MDDAAQRRVCENQSTRFVEYTENTDSWVFKHFSYGHRESDEEDDDELVAKFVHNKSGPQPTTSGADGDGETVGVEEKKTTNDAPAFATFPNECFQLNDIPFITAVDDMHSDCDNNQLLPSIMNNGCHASTNYTLMKSAIFDDLEDFVDAGSDVRSSESGILELSQYVSDSSPKRINTDDSRISESKYIPLNICEEKIADLGDKPETVTFRESDISSTDSTILIDANLADIIAFKGRSFKIGWTKTSTILCLSRADSTDNVQGHIAIDISNYRSISFKKLANLDKNTFQNLEQHLEQQYLLSTIKNINRIPFAKALNGSKLLRAHQKVVKNLSNNNYEKQIWELLVILFDDNIFTDFVPRDIYKTKIENVRKHYLSIWMKSVVETSVEREVNYFNCDNLSKILSYISGNQIELAAELAMNSNYVNLALLISQLPTMTRGKLETQLKLWEDCDVYDFLDDALLKIYAILAGKTIIKVRDCNISVFEGMGWIRTLALYFWYVIRKNDPITVAVKMYEQLLEEHELALFPIPDHKCAPEKVYDLRFLLLKFYGDDCPITYLFNTFTYTNDPLDYRLGWFICQIFRSLNHPEISIRVKNYMHVNFATQLEQMGLWHWAIYILTHLEDNCIKRELIVNILGRHIQVRDEETPEFKLKELMLIKNFKIPKEWIDYQKALKATESQNYKDAYHYFCFSCEWQSANDVAVRYLLPNLLLSYDYKYLIELLTPLSEHSEVLSNWEEAGGLLTLEYAKLGAHFDTIISQNNLIVNKNQLYNFYSAVKNVSARFNNFISYSYLHDVCVAEISRRIMLMLRKLLRIVDENTYEICVDTAIHAQTLPLTSDDLKQELNFILRNFLNRIA